ncbi:MAG TPA: molybdopterin dinucleotide binding domain-containing protein [Planctomycetota bacterium]|nr:molybdopterin dinucleotide binding domain-containing protein [Planctomycetota bacterium]
MTADRTGAEHPKARVGPWELAVGPPPEQWDDWTELDPAAWPERREKRYRCVPTICFNCESACGLLAFVDKATGQVEKFEGNPVHPGSRGRTCAKGPATINQIQDPERILAPLRRVGPRGSGQWAEATWEEALADIGGRIRRALQEERHDEVVYHVGRPGEDHFVLRMLEAWGVDGHNSHTNVCSASARLGYSLWFGADRPSPDHSSAKFILLLSAHLETGHYFNPHAQRIVDAKESGARIAVIDTRLSNTSTHAERWISSWPGSEAALLLAVARELLESDRVDHAFVRRWTNWRAYLADRDPQGPGTYERFVELLRALYAEYTPAFAVEECRIEPGTVEYLAQRIAEAGPRFASHLWRNTAAGNLGGWQVARALLLLHVLSGSVGTVGGVNPNAWDKAHPHPTEMPPPIRRWNERHWPREWPLAHYEMSFLLPHLLREQGTRIDVYFTRVYNPVWTNPDGCSWIEMFEEPDRIGCHVALTPTWNETAQWADWVLPMGLASERHDLMSQETHAGTWIGFRQPVGREFARREGRATDSTLGTNPGAVWEEAEFWIALTWRIDPDGALGIRRWFESKARPGTPIALDEYWADVFRNVPGLPDAARAEGLEPLEYMRRYGAFAVPYAGQERYAEPAPQGGLELEDGRRVKGFPTPSKRLEFYAPVMREWGFEDGAVPAYQRSQVHWRELDLAAGERALLPTFRLPTLIHTRSANSKWLTEISHTNPLWMHPEDAAQFGVETGDLVRVVTRIGHFVPRVWVTEGIHPGVVACSHHVGRWRLHDGTGGRLASARVGLARGPDGAGGTFLFRQEELVGPYASSDPDTARVHWREAGVNQNLTFPVQPDPASGMHCWHQKVRLERATPGDRYGDVFVDTRRSREVYAEWKALTKPAPGPGGLRRPLHMKRPLRPVDDAYRL